ncbi:hypothetical protein J1N35_027133 [Gossypium stocksii]|uniref:DUF4283 domain-containing protein n=1 Tax=Gossypium stocksii TaxID=47602 RepID=A0A9D3ZXR1_9ROSI|nr:hypothetical protein J1N35_027133 [Gossypium stocksii]
MTEEETTNLNIVDEEEEPVQALGNEEVVEEDYGLCLVGPVLMDSMVHFPSMRNILVDLWQPLGGVSIMEMGENNSCFDFSMRHLIVFYIIEKGEDLLQVPLIYAIFWVQVHNLPMSFMSKGMARQIENFIGQFLKHDAALVMKEVKKFMCIKVDGGITGGGVWLGYFSKSSTMKGDAGC